MNIESRSTASVDRYPDFFIVGAAKAGTTSIYQMLSKHSDIYLPREKEPHYFFDIYEMDKWKYWDSGNLVPLRSTLKYASLQRYLSLFASANEGQILGEGSTQYLHSTTAAKDIYAANPEAKIIICLREPIGRAFSAFTYARSRGEEPENSFLRALNSCALGHRRRQFAIDYVSGSDYESQINRYLEVFPRNQVLIILMEDLIRDSLLVCEEVHNFLGVSVPQTLFLPPSNVSVEIQSGVGMAVRVAAKRLRRYSPELFDQPIFRMPMQFLINKLGKRPPRMTNEERSFAAFVIPDQIAAIGKILGRDLVSWRTARTREES